MKSLAVLLALLALCFWGLPGLILVLLLAWILDD